MNYYNEIDAHAAETIRQLIAAGLIPPGDVDERSITDVRPDDLKGYVQCHFFAGIAGWSLALRIAGWPDDRPVWTGSCPCQPFSSAGKRKGHADERHLWPEFYRLARECRPERMFGEQVASAIGHGWLDGICADLEAEGYAVGAVVLGAHSVGAPHIRKRLWWVADGNCQRCIGEQISIQRRGSQQASVEAVRGGGDVWLENSGSGRREVEIFQPTVGCSSSGIGKTDGDGGAGTPWSNFSIIHFRDGKSRRIEPGTSPLVDGLPRGMVRGNDPGRPHHPAEARQARIKGYGNAINPYVAAEFIRAAGGIE